MRSLILILSFASLNLICFGQELTSTIRGKIVDDYTKMPLKGASVILFDSIKHIGTISDQYGNFKFEKITTGRQSIAIQHLGYKTASINNFIVVSGKETFLSIDLKEELFELDEVLIRSNPKRTSKNDFVYVSGRNFNVEETERYAGTNGDPARMASYFAGVMATGDTRNDIIIRGNSPLGLLWRLEGVDIPNPNHFAAMGTNGGPICILNNNQLRNSDFISGAFPAQYGNALSGVFDLNMRNGNNKKRETTLQMSTGGLELGLEGYFKKEKNASYMINYRYAFLELFDKIGIKFDIPTIPKYQDLSFKFNFPLKNKGIFSIWGLGGISNMEMYADENDLNITSNINTFFGSNMGASGITYKYINDKSYLRTSIAITGMQSYMKVDSVLSPLQSATFFGSNYDEIHSIFTSTYRQKLNRKVRFETGITYTHFSINYLDTAKHENTFVKIAGNNGNYGFLQSYVQLEYSLTQKFKLSTGIHAQYLFLNEKYSIEPRASIKYEMNTKTNFHFGYGLHSQIQQGNLYFKQTLNDTINTIYNLTNSEVGFSKSHHFVAGISHLFNPNLKINLEIYYQHLFDIPIESKSSSYSSINYGSDFYSLIEDSLINGGKGYNRGIEFTLERFYNKGFYYLATMSLFESKFQGSDGVWRNTVFNNNYIVNLLGGYELKLPKNESLAINANLVWAGGLRYTPIDIVESISLQETVYLSEQTFEQKHKDFFKINLKLIYRVNKSKLSYETGFGINNITNRKNIMQQSFNVQSGEIVTDYQMGIMPEGMFRIYF